MKLEDVQKQLADQDRRFSAAMQALSASRREIPKALLDELARAFDEVGTVTTTTNKAIPSGIRV